MPRPRRLARLAVALWACIVTAKPAATGFSGVALIADGGPFTVVRRDSLFTGSAGVTLVAGDMVATGSGALVLITSQGGNLLAIGPFTEAYFVPRADLTTVHILKGWVKADVTTGGMRLDGTRLGIQVQQPEAVVLLHVDERSDAIFDEQGSARLVLRDEAGAHLDQETAANQFFVREDRSDVGSQPRPSDEFVKTMPPAFRDPLPGHLKLPAPVPPRPVRPVSYSDIEAWLMSPPDWRDGFIARFRRLLQDPAFFAAMDAHLALFPEWKEILHPPPPEAGPPEGLRSEPKPTLPDHKPEQGQKPR